MQKIITWHEELITYSILILACVFFAAGLIRNISKIYFEIDPLDLLRNKKIDVKNVLKDYKEIINTTTTVLSDPPTYDSELHSDFSSKDINPEKSKVSENFQTLLSTLKENLENSRHRIINREPLNLDCYCS